MQLRADAEFIFNSAIASAMPDAAVRDALAQATLTERVSLVAIGKAGYRMAKAACELLGARVREGVVVTKYGHAGEALGPLAIFEAGHPVPDENAVLAAQAAMALASRAGAGDTVILLVSGGGSALFELPLVPLSELQDVNRQLLACGASIVEMNTVRKRLSAVKGGRFAKACAPAQVVAVVLSDIVGDPLDMIASGPACPDDSTCADALAVVEKYDLHLSDHAMTLLHEETPKSLDNVTTFVTGSLKKLCASAAQAAAARGYEPTILTASLVCEAKDAGSMLASIAQYYADTPRARAFIMGGETVVRLTGDGGLGGRNQELALAAAEGIAGMENACVFAVGTDGTDGPTDAAGGYVDGGSAGRLRAAGVDPAAALKSHDSYHALRAVDGLIMTGPTGTNVNDLYVLLLAAQAPV